MSNRSGPGGGELDGRVALGRLRARTCPVGKSVAWTLVVDEPLDDLDGGIEAAAHVEGQGDLRRGPRAVADDRRHGAPGAGRRHGCRRGSRTVVAACGGPGLGVGGLRVVDDDAGDEDEDPAELDVVGVVVGSTRGRGSGTCPGSTRRSIRAVRPEQLGDRVEACRRPGRRSSVKVRLGARRRADEGGRARAMGWRRQRRSRGRQACRTARATRTARAGPARSGRPPGRARRRRARPRAAASRGVRRRAGARARRMGDGHGRQSDGATA